MGVQNPHNNNEFFRLSFIEDDSHKVKWTLRFRKHGFILMAATVVLIVTALSYSIIAFTPLRTLIPGYPDAKSKKTAISNAIRIDSLENSILRWQIYADGISRVLSGGDTGVLDTLLKAGASAYISEKSREELAHKDSVLREAVLKEEQFQISSNKARTLPVEGRLFFLPVKGVVIRSYDRAIHPGVDISAPANSTVNAIYDGTVIYAGWDDSVGNIIILQHSSDLISIYQHNRKLLKKTGESVKAGAPIALVGGTGSLDNEEYLHLEMWYQGEPLDPAKYISF